MTGSMRHRSTGPGPTDPGPTDSGATDPAAVDSGAPGSAAVATDQAWLRHLRVVGIAVPVLFLVALQVVRPVVDRVWPGHGILALGVLGVLGAMAFGVAMFVAIGRGHRAVLEQNRQLASANAVGEAVHGLLLRVSRREPTADVLCAIAGTARSLLDTDAAGLCLEPAAAALLATDGLRDASRLPTCVSVEGVNPCAAPASGCPRSDGSFAALTSVALHGPDGLGGRLWVGRRAGEPFGERDSALLATLAELAVVALDHARALEQERRGAVLAERDRIAREMHDSLAQVLGVTHLQLRALEARPELAGAHEVRGGLAELAGLCHEAYRDVREAILGLRESSSGRTLLESLAAYVDKFSRVSGIVTTLETDQPDLALGPRCEVQVIRVIQEALTNVRKHSGATTAVVRVSAGPQSTSFVVEDDGDGFDPAAHRADAGGFGLHTMRERTELVNGSLTVDSAPGQGTRVVVRLPSAPRAHVPEAVGA